MRYTARASYYYPMNSISIFLYIISIIMWWAGFNYAAARASTTRRRKLFSTAAALALAWPFAFIALAAALATKAAANLMIAVGDHINNTWDAAVSDEDDTIVTKLTSMGTAVRVRRENTEHGNDTAASSDEDRDIATTTGEEAHPSLADNMPLMPPPPPPATDEDEHDTPNRGNTGDDAETAETADSDDSADSNNINDGDETVTIQKVSLSDII
jgi:hypothetical protein